MEDIISSNNVDSQDASHEPNSKSRSSSKRRSKTRSKVWEKVAWFTRKTKSGRENKVESPEEARKDEKSPCLNVLRNEDGVKCRLDVNAIENNSPSLSKTKSKLGIRKTKSFNYLKRKKLKNYTSEPNSPLHEEAAKENTDTLSNCQTATGNFHDFASVGRRCSSITTSTSVLVSEMAKEMNFKQEEQFKGSIKSSLSLPLSLLSLNERSANVCSQNCRGFLCTCKPNNNILSGPNYNSWPRKKRLLVTSQAYEGFSPPQKQKKICVLRKTATFNGFDSSKLSIKESKGRELRGVKSTPFLSGQNQIKNQNGLTIGVIHFYKSSRNRYSTFSPVATQKMYIPGPLLSNDVKHFDFVDESSTEHISDADSDNDGILNIVNLHTDLKSKVDDSPKELSPISQSDLQNDKILVESEQQSSQSSCNIENISRDLTEGANIGAIVSMKECFVVEDPINEVCSLTFKSRSRHKQNINQIDVSKQDILQMSESFCTSLDDSSESSSLDLVHLHSSKHLYTTDKKTVNGKLEIIQEVPDYIGKVNNEYIDSSKECGKCNIVQKEEAIQHNMCSETKPTETGIYCIKIEDQVTDFSKEGKIDFQSKTKLQASSTLSEPFVVKVKENDYVKKNPLFQSANNSHTSDTVCAMTNNSTVKGKHELVVPERTMFNDSVPSSNVVTLEKEMVKSYDVEEMRQRIESVNNSPVSCVTPTNTSDKDQSKDILKSTLLLSSQTLLKRSKPKVDGLHFKHQTQTILDWFSEFNDEQKNILLKKLLERCEVPQMHLLSVVMEPALHKTCPSNCQDMLAWLPHPVTNVVMSYLDPESLCRCSQVNRYWNSLASNPLIWKRLCKSSEWQLSRKTEEKQLLIYTQLCGTVQWKKMFAERYLLRKNWLNGRCKVRTFEGHTQGISCVQFDDTRIVSGSTDKTIKVWDLSRDDSHAVLTLAGHSGTVRCLNLNGNRLVSGSVDRSIKVWDLSFESYWSGASCKVTMVGHMHTVRCLQVDDEKVVSGSYDKTLKVWDLKTGHCKLTLRGHNAAVLCVQFDDNKIVSGSYDNTIKVWSLQEGECLMTLAGHHDAVTCLNLTQDGRKVISGSLDHNLKFWDLATGKCIGTLDWIRSEGHTGVIRCLQSDSWRIVSAGDDKTLKMWSLETGQRLLTLRCHTDGVTCLQFNDYRIVSGSYDKTVKVWNFSPENEFLNPT